jgi:hypothetical protein
MISDLTETETNYVSGGCSCSCYVSGGNAPSLSGLFGEVVGAAVSAYGVNRYLGSIANNLLNNQAVEIPGSLTISTIYGITKAYFAIRRYIAYECTCNVSC